MKQGLISIVVPVYNSATILHNLCAEIEKIRVQESWALELILVNDGSRDDSFSVIRDLCKKYAYIRAFNLSRNFGQQAALSIGLENAQGDYIAFIDDDLQDPPSLLPQFVDKIDDGYDVVYAIRKKRKENWLKVLMYKSFYRILNKIGEIKIPLDSGDFCMISKKARKSMLLLKEQRPYLRGIRSWIGHKQIGIEYEREPRFDGKSNHTIRSLFGVAGDGIFSFSTVPIKLVSIIGVFILSFSLLYGAGIILKYFLYGATVKGFTTLSLLILFCGSANLIALGIIGEYIARIYAEGKNRPLAIVDEKIEHRNLDKSKEQEPPHATQ